MVLVFITLLLSAVYAAGDPGPCEGPLECWLQSVVIDIPNQTVNGSKSQYTFTNLTCKDITLRAIDSERSQPNTVNFFIGGVGVQCSGDYTWHNIKIPTVHGSGSFLAVIDNSTFDLQLQVTSDGQAPVEPKWTQCFANITITNLTASASIVQELEELIDTLLCQAFTNGSAKGLNVVLGVIDEVMRELATPQPTPPVADPVMDVPLLNWQQNGMFEGGLSALLGPHLVNCIVDLATGYQGDIYIDIDSNTTLPVAQGDLVLRVNSLNISGLDTFNTLKLFHAATPYSLLSTIGLDSLEIDLRLSLIAQDTYVKNSTIKLHLVETTLLGQMLFAVKQELVNHTWGQLFGDHCILNELHSINFTSLIFNTTVAQMDVLPENPIGLQGTVDEIFDSLFDLYTQDFGDFVSEFIVGLVNMPIREALNVLTTQLLRDYQATHSCPPPVLHNTTHIVQWQDSNLIKIIDVLLNDVVGPSGATDFVTCFSGGASSKVVTTKSSIVGLYFSGFNTFEEVKMLTPYPVAADPYSLNNYIHMAPSNYSLTFESKPAYIHINISHLDGTYENITVILSDIEILINIVLRMDSYALADLSLEHFSRSCAATAVLDSQLSALNLSMSSVVMITDTKNASGVYQTIVDGQNFTRFINGFFSHLFNGIETLMNLQISNNLVDAPWDCLSEPIPVLGSSGLETWVYICIAGAAVLLVALIGGLAYWYTRPPKPEKPPVVIDWRESLLHNPKIPLLIRYALPLAVAGNIALFISSNVSIGAEVYIRITSNTVNVPKVPLFDFTLQNSVHDMWEAGVYPLSLLIAIFSGGWPYVKLACMFVAWVFPVAIISHKKRETLLMWIDALGKWSLIDCFVMVLMMVAFRFHIGAGSAAIDVIVNPGVGFHTFLLGTMMSLTLGHFALALHRFTASTLEVQDGGDTEAFREHIFKFQDRHYRFSKFGQFTMTLLLICTLALVVVGCCIDSFNFEFKGLAGLVLRDEASASYSVWQVGDILPNSAEDPNGISIRWIQAAFFIYAFFMPLCYLGVVIYLWVMPLTLKSQLKVFKISEIFYAWSGLEVFIVSIIAALLEISTFAQFIIGDMCDGINKLLAIFMDGILDGDDKCFDVVATLTHGCWVLFPAAVIFMFVCLSLEGLCHSALDERLEKYRYAVEEVHKPIGRRRARSSGFNPTDDVDDAIINLTFKSKFANLMVSFGLLEEPSSSVVGAPTDYQPLAGDSGETVPERTLSVN